MHVVAMHAERGIILGFFSSHYFCRSLRDSRSHPSRLFANTRGDTAFKVGTPKRNPLHLGGIRKKWTKKKLRKLGPSSSARVTDRRTRLTTRMCPSSTTAGSHRVICRYLTKAEVSYTRSITTAVVMRKKNVGIRKRNFFVLYYN